MTTIKRSLAIVVLMLVWGSALAAQQPPAQQGEFIPIDQLPPTEQMAAAPLLIGAYAFVLVVFFVYVASLARRLSRVQREMDRLDTSIKHTGKA